MSNFWIPETILSLNYSIIMKNGVFWDVTPFLVHRFLSPWWWRSYVPPRRRFLQGLHGVTAQKTPFFIVTVVKTSNLTYSIIASQKRGWFSPCHVTPLTRYPRRTIGHCMQHCITARFLLYLLIWQPVSPVYVTFNDAWQIGCEWQILIWDVPMTTVLSEFPLPFWGKSHQTYTRQ
jgi:hypothetical protein